MLTSRWVRLLAVLIGVLPVIVACGGGGGDASVVPPAGPAVRQPLPTLSQDILPSGTRLDVRDRNYFPAELGDTWIYDQTVDGGSAGEVRRLVTFASGDEFAIDEIGAPGNDRVTYRRTSQGIAVVAPLAEAGNALLSQALPTLLEYPEPFYPVGSTRQLIRQGSLGDVDGDGIADSFRVEYRHTLVGFETLSLRGGPLADTARFRSVFVFTVQPSNLARPITTVTVNEETWLAPGLGLVQSIVSATDAGGAFTIRPTTLRLSGGTIGGVTLFLAPSDGTLTRIPLVHAALVYDAPRQRFLASVPGSVPNDGNRIAIIDAATGRVSYSAPVGSEPGALALAADGSALLVGLNGTGEVIKLRLPDFAVQWRARLPTGFFGATRAETISVSPVDPDVVAVSLYRSSVSPRHDGVVLVRSGVVQPLRTQDHTGSNLIVFGADGTSVYGFNSETTEFGLRRLSVLPDGLREEFVVRDSGSDGFATLKLDLMGPAPGRLLLGRNLHTTPDLGLAGQVGSGGRACRWHAAAARIVCLSSTSSGDQSIWVVDPDTLVVTATPVFLRSGAGSFDGGEIVAGGRGVVALRLSSFNPTLPATGIWLFASPQIP